MKEPNKKEKYDLRDLDVLKLKELNMTLNEDKEAKWVFMDIDMLIRMSKTHNLVFDSKVKWALSSYLDRDKATKNALELF